MSAKSSGYLEFLKSNKAYRNLWYGQVTSELGDWLNSIALYTLVIQLSGSSGLALAYAMMAKLMPIFFVSPLAGVLIDRMSRKAILITSDILRFFVVLGFLFVQTKSDLWLLYALTILQMALAGFFEPARSAIIPSITAKKDLVTANALGGSTWSVMSALGSALGGGVVSLFGLKAAFLIDASTFLLSAWFIFRIPVQTKIEKPSSSFNLSGWGAILEGANYLSKQPRIFLIALLKSGLALSGGVMTLIPLFSNKAHSTPQDYSMAMGILHMARGIGAAIGPVLIRKLFGEGQKLMEWAIAVSFIFCAMSYFCFSKVDELETAALFLGLASLFGSIIWVFSSALIHLTGDDRFLGRVFSLEMALLTLVMGLSNAFVGVTIDRFGWTPKEAAETMAYIILVPGGIWTAFLCFVGPSKGQSTGPGEEKEKAEDFGGGPPPVV